ncbi:MAG TPA: YihY/virulence factor BrkB family protein [Rubricoccaceae bacterium]|nr:YihY/virulence factor BrkB family protein [Rubricoccaceae bacterium]
MRRVTRHVNTILGIPRYYVWGLLRRLFSSPIFLWAQAIAFKVLVTLIPLTLLLTGIFGLVLRQPDPFGTVAGFFRSFLPPSQSEPVVGMLSELQRASGALTIVGAVALLVTIMTLFTTLRTVIVAAIGPTHRDNRTILQGYAFDIQMMLQAGLLFLLSFAVTVGAGVMGDRIIGWLTAHDYDAALVARGWALLLRLLGLVVPYALSLLMFAQLFFFVPRPRPPLRSAFVGAAFTAVLFEAAKNGFAYYMRYAAFYSRHEGDGGGALGGLSSGFGLVLALVFWVYLSGLTLVFGAIVTGLHEQRTRPRRSSAARRLWHRLTRHVGEHPTPGRNATEPPPAVRTPEAPAGDGALEQTPGLPADPEGPGPASADDR